MVKEQSPASEIEPRFALYAGYAAVSIVTVLIVVKTWAYYASGSPSILSSLMDSLLDSVVSVIALASIYYAQRPADEDHRYGHGKMEGVSALFQAAVILGGGVFLVFESLGKLVHPEPVQAHLLGVAVMVLAMLLSAILVYVQRLSLAKAPSLAVEADSAHYGSDILINAGVMLVLILTMNGAPLWLDPLFALMVAVFLGMIARKIGMKAVDMLLDRELPEAERGRLIEILDSDPEVKGWHDLRSHRHGMAVIVSVDIEVDANLSLLAAHEIARQVEGKMLSVFPNAEILIHVDPEGDTQDTRHRVKGVHHT
jgi:ferrous-iron efflux pump FieF